MALRAAIALLAFWLAVPMRPPDAGATGKRPAPASKRVTGTVRVVGSEPCARTVVTVFRDGVPSDCLVEGPLEAALRDGYQDKAVTVEGAACPKVPPGFADCIVPTKILPAE